MKDEQKIKTIPPHHIKDEHRQFNYQPVLTTQLDKHKGDFTQETINQIILWKVNRYAHFDSETLSKINEISGDETEIDYNDYKKTKDILTVLLDTKGVALAMASTILRFKNPKIYQIIDQRAYRVIYGKELNIGNNVNNAIELYLEYLRELRKVCASENIPFEQSDRILYNADRDWNSGVPIKY